MKPEIGRRWSTAARVFAPWPLGVDPRRPGVSLWTRIHDLGPLASHADFDGAEAYQMGRICVISNVENVTPGGWSWHVSVTENGRRAGRRAMLAVRAAFQMQDAEEDNHGSSSAWTRRTAPKRATPASSPRTTPPSPTTAPCSCRAG